MIKINKTAAPALFIGLLAANSAFAIESIQCTETGANLFEPSIIKIGVGPDQELLDGADILTASIHSPSLHLNYSVMVRREQRSQTLAYVDYFNPKAFRLVINLAPTAAGTILGALVLNQGLLFEKKIPNLDCSIVNQPASPSEFCRNWTDIQKNTALISFAKSGSVSQLDSILDCGADVNFKDAKGCSAFLYLTDLACGYQPSAGNSNPTNPNAPEPPIFGTSGSIGLTDRMNVLLNQGAILEAKDPISRETALSKLVKYGELEGVDLLLELEADVNAQDRQGNTPLMKAALRRDEMMARTLLRASPDLTLMNKEGLTAHAIAVKAGVRSWADLLIPADATATLQGTAQGGCTPSMVHVMNGKPVEFILKATDSKMFLFEAPDLGLELMAMPGGQVKKTITPKKTGTFPFTCGVHGGPANQQTRGSIMVM